MTSLLPAALVQTVHLVTPSLRMSECLSSNDTDPLDGCAYSTCLRGLAAW